MKKLLSFCHRAGYIAFALAASALGASTFTNPLLPVGPDPWVIARDGTYYFTSTTARNLTIWETADITDLRNARKKVVWTPPASGPYSHDIWAPELHFLDNKWYLYFAADAGDNSTHRIWVLENAARDPLDGNWTFKGELTDASNKWAIDPTVFEDGGKLYVVWSGWEGDKDGAQNLYIAPLKNPWTIASARVRISTPQFAWERIGDMPGHQPPHVDVNEGPEILQHGDKIFLIYSASGCWTDHYALGMVTAAKNSNLLDPHSWKKWPQPVFSELPAAHAYGTGHNGFFRSPDGKQDWIIYHANPEPGEGCKDFRSPRIQPFTWKADGSPNFGTPVSIGMPIEKPSGTAAR